MSSFLTAFDYLMQWEDSGLTGQVTEDEGGRTRFGIAEKYHPELAAQGFYTCDKDVAIAAARSTYLLQYWTPLSCFAMPQDVANRVLDEGVNAGTKEDGIVLQRALRDCGLLVNLDGKIGRLTLMAIDQCDIAELLDSYRQERWKSYQLILAAHPEWEKFRKDWERRSLA